GGRRFPASRAFPDGFARGLARNTQLILLEEANLAKVADPAAGTGTMGDITGQLCRAAWKLFQDIERAGGAAKALETGLIQRQVAAVRAVRAAAVATRRAPLPGTSEFSHLRELPLALLPAPPPLPPHTPHHVPHLPTDHT